ncbi:MAG: virulence factor SrfB, partial [Bilophila sp.]
THGLLAKRINSHGTPLACFDDPLFKQNPVLRKQEREIAFESHYTRSSLMLFMLVEILLQAHTTINSPGQRARRELPNVPRRLRRIIFTVPSGMPIAEQRIYRRWVLWAVRALWDALGWQDFYMDARIAAKRARPDYRLSPAVRCDWDEATCTQLVYLYNELSRKFQGDAHHLFGLVGTPRKDYGTKPAVRMAAIDIGGGTTDLSITTFVLENEESDTARISPNPEFRDGFNIAGDDILREIVNRHVLPAIGEAAVRHGVRDARAFLAQLFGRDVMDNSQENRNRRAQFARQVAVPVALALLSVYEQADLLSGSGAFTCTFRDMFRKAFDDASDPAPTPRPDASKPDAPASSADEAPEEPRFAFKRSARPGNAVLQYVEQEVARYAPNAAFSLLDVEIRIDPRLIDHTVREALGRPLADLCEVIQRYDCDILLLTGRPSRWSGIIASIFAKLPVPPDRILPMCRFRVGNWYPFADALGNITDPKTTVVVGAILCALAEGHLEGFSFDTSRLKLKSTARFIGEMDINGQIKRPKVWFNVDVDSAKEQELPHDVVFAGPIAVGFRQLDAERWTTTRFHIVDFATEEARRNAAGKLPYRLKMRLVVAELDPEVSREHDEGELFIDDIEAADGSSVPTRDVEVRLQTLPLDEGYWLDTGIVYQAI